MFEPQNSRDQRETPPPMHAVMPASGAIAALPVHNHGRIVTVLIVHFDQDDAPDEATQDLLMNSPTAKRMAL